RRYADLARRVDPVWRSRGPAAARGSDAAELLLRCSSRGAVWWVISMALCAGLTAILKASFYGCPPSPDLHSPGGHTSFSVLVYSAMALVTATESTGLGRVITNAGTAGFLAVPRLRLYVHSAAERFGSGDRRSPLNGIQPGVYRAHRRGRGCPR